MERTSYCIEVMDCCMVLMPPWIAAKASMIYEKLISGSEGGTVWEDEAMSGKSTGMAARMGTSSSESSLRSCALDYIKVCLPMGCWIFIFSSLVMMMLDWRMIWMSRYPKGRTVLPSSRASNITLIICLHRQKGKRRWMAYTNWAFFRVKSLGLTTGHKLCCTILASKRWEGDRE
jgi:hypothetical protein